MSSTNPRTGEGSPKPPFRVRAESFLLDLASHLSNRGCIRQNHIDEMESMLRTAATDAALGEREIYESRSEAAQPRKQEVIQQLCKMMGRAWSTIDPNAHEPCDCVCGREGRYQNAGHALTFMEEAISEAIARHERGPADAQPDWREELILFRESVAAPPQPCPHPYTCDNYTCDVNRKIIAAFVRVGKLLGDHGELDSRKWVKPRRESPQAITCAGCDVPCQTAVAIQGARCGECIKRLSAKAWGIAEPTDTVTSEGLPELSEHRLSVLACIADNTCFVTMSGAIMDLADFDLVTVCKASDEHRCGWRVTARGEEVLRKASAIEPLPKSAAVEATPNASPADVAQGVREKLLEVVRWKKELGLLRALAGAARQYHEDCGHDEPGAAAQCDDVCEAWKAWASAFALPKDASTVDLHGEGCDCPACDEPAIGRAGLSSSPASDDCLRTLYEVTCPRGTTGCDKMHGASRPASPLALDDWNNLGDELHALRRLFSAVELWRAQPHCPEAGRHFGEGNCDECKAVVVLIDCHDLAGQFTSPTKGGTDGK